MANDPSPGQRAFWKMHGLGNDFVVFDATDAPLDLNPGQVRRLAHRREGIGCDQVLVLAPATRPDADFDYRVFNADGGEVGQCGNGARCVTRLAIDRGHIASGPVRLATTGGILTAEPAGEDITVDMGRPSFAPASLPAELDPHETVHALDSSRGPVRFRAVSLGNPHIVIRVDDVAAAPVRELGAELERHPAFPEGVNVGFVQVGGAESGRLRVWERGAGETRACGSGACAAVAVGRRAGWFGPRVELGLQGGSLVIFFPEEAQGVRMTGPARHVFEGWIRP